MKLYASVFAVFLAATSCVLAQNTSGAPEPPSTLPDSQQTSPRAMPPDQQAPPSEAQSEQGQNRVPGQDEMSNLGSRIQQSIASDSILENSDVKVQVHEDQLVLTGTVSSQNAKDRAEQIAAPYATQNNLKLVNHISVQS